jgi:hypothetical protein
LPRLALNWNLLSPPPVWPKLSPYFIAQIFSCFGALFGMLLSSFAKCHLLPNPKPQTFVCFFFFHFCSRLILHLPTLAIESAIFLMAPNSFHAEYR